MRSPKIGMALLLAVAISSPQGLANAATSAPAVARGSLVVEAGSGKILSLTRPAANIFVADPQVLEVRPASTHSLFAFGIKPGHTTVAALDTSGAAVALFDVTVSPNASTAALVARSVASATSLLPGAPSSVVVGPEQHGVTLGGSVPDAAHANTAVATAALNLDNGEHVNDAMSVSSSATVGLKVRITEMTREVTRNLGVDWSAIGTIGRYALDFATTNGVSSTLKSVYTGNKLTVDTVIEALATDNLVHVLAEPTLTARSGESASFLVGGEYPIPVAQASSSSSNTISVDYKEYGVSLAFVPTVLSSGRISLHVRPEVSQLATSTSAGAITLSEGNGSLSIPALTVRRAETTIELGSGQSFAIAGLLQDDTTQSNNFTPGLGELPILGSLFRSDAYQHNQTELVIIVTPYIVGSVDDPDTLHAADAGYTPPNDLERVLLLRQHGRTPTTSIPGDAGFIVQ